MASEGSTRSDEIAIDETDDAGDTTCTTTTTTTSVTPRRTVLLPRRPDYYQDDFYSAYDPFEGFDDVPSSPPTSRESGMVGCVVDDEFAMRRVDAFSRPIFHSADDVDDVRFDPFAPAAATASNPHPDAGDIAPHPPHDDDDDEDDGRDRGNGDAIDVSCDNPPDLSSSDVITFVDDAPLPPPPPPPHAMDDDGVGDPSHVGNIPSPLENAIPTVVDGDCVDFSSSVVDPPTTAYRTDDTMDEDDGFLPFSSVDRASTPIGNALPSVDGDIDLFESSDVGVPSVENEYFQTISSVEEVPTSIDNVVPYVDGDFVCLASSGVDFTMMATRTDQTMIEGDNFLAFHSVEEVIEGVIAPDGNAFPSVGVDDFVDFASSEFEAPPMANRTDENLVKNDDFVSFSSVDDASTPIENAIPSVDGDIDVFASSKVDVPPVENEHFQTISSVEEVPTSIDDAIPNVDGDFIGLESLEVDGPMMSTRTDQTMVEEDIILTFPSVVEVIEQVIVPFGNAIPSVVDEDFVDFASSEVDVPSMAKPTDQPVDEDDDFLAFSSVDEVSKPIKNSIPSVDGDIDVFASSEEGFQAFSLVEEVTTICGNLIPNVDGDIVSVASSEVDGPMKAQQSPETMVVDNSFQDFSSFDEIQTDRPAEEETVISEPFALDEAGAKSTSRYVDANTNELNGVDDNLFDRRIPSNVNGSTASLSLEPKSNSTAEVDVIPETTDAENDFCGLSSFDDAPAERLSAVFGSTDDDDFGDFEAHPETQTVVAIENSPGKSEDDRGGFDEFGDSDKFDCTPVVANVGLEICAFGAVTSQPLAVSNDVDEFGAFGEFEAFEEAPTADSLEASDKHEAFTAPGTQHTIIFSSSENGDGFGDFEDFDAFMEAPTESKPSNVGWDSCAVAASPVEAVISTENDGGDEFGDFGDFDAFEEASDGVPPEEEEENSANTPPVELSASTQALPMLNEHVRLIFQNVFTIDSPIAFDLTDRGECTELPFDIPLSSILVSAFFCTMACFLMLNLSTHFHRIPLKSKHLPTKDRVRDHPHKSDQDLAKIKEYFKGPPSRPITILSDERWFPYSHYEFKRDGSPYAELVERTRTTSVPEMLSIELPTGFDASRLSGSASSAPTHPYPASSNRAAPTIVDFPSTPKSSREGKKIDAQRKAS